MKENENSMTLLEIHERFSSEWILIKDPVASESLELECGTVLFHSKSRDEVYEKAIELKPTHSAIIFTGLIEQDTAILL